MDLAADAFAILALGAHEFGRSMGMLAISGRFHSPCPPP
jgi:hypothetical protein